MAPQGSDGRQLIGYSTASRSRRIFPSQNTDPARDGGRNNGRAVFLKNLNGTSRLLSDRIQIACSRSDVRHNVSLLLRWWDGSLQSPNVGHIDGLMCGTHHQASEFVPHPTKDIQQELWHDEIPAYPVGEILTRRHLAIHDRRKSH